MNRIYYNKGFIALVSAIVISLVLIGLSIAASSSQFVARFGLMDHELQAQSTLLAQSCGNVALLRIAQNYTYAPASGGDVVSVGDDQCTIVSVVYSAEDTVNHQKNAYVTASAHTHDVWSNMVVTATIKNPVFALMPGVKNITIQSWTVATSSN